MDGHFDPAALQYLQKFAMESLLSPTERNLSDFGNAVARSDKELLSAVVRKGILQPALNIFRNHPSKGKLVEKALDIIRSVFLRIQTPSWNVFKDISSSLCVLLIKTVEKDHVDFALCENVVDVLLILSQATPREFLFAGFDAGNIQGGKVVWTHIIFQSVKLCELKSSRRGKVAALRLIDCAINLEVEAAKHYSLHAVQEGILSVLTASFPGICGACFHVLSDPPGTGYIGHEVIVQALSTLGHQVSSVLRDERVASIARPTSTLRKLDVLIEDGAGDAPLDERSPTSNQISEETKWKEEAIKNTRALLQKLTFLAANEAFDVRQAYCDFVRCVALDCFELIEDIFPTLLKSILPLRDDPQPEVQSAADGACSDLRKAIQKHAVSSDLIERLQDEFLSDIETLSLTVTSSSEQQLLRDVEALAGYGRFVEDLSERSPLIGNVPEMLVDVLLVVCEIDSSGFDLLGVSEDYLPFKFARSSSMRKAVLSFVGALNSATVLEMMGLLISQLFDTRRTQKQPERLYILFILVHAVKPSDWIQASCQDTINAALDLFVSSDLWRYTSSLHGILLSKRCIGRREETELSFAESSTAADMKPSLISMCFVMESISVIADIMGRSFIPNLHSTLYLLLAKTSSEIANVANVAQTSLDSIAKATGYSSTSVMVEDNYEYLVDAVTLRTRNVHRNPEAVIVLDSSLKFISPNVLPLLLLIVKTIIQRLDEMCAVAALPFVTVLKPVVRKLAEWYAVDEKPGLVHAEDDPVGRTTEFIKKGYYPWKSVTNVTENSDEVAGAEKGEEPEKVDEFEDEQKPVPDHIKAVVEIVKRCAYLLPVDDRQLRAAVLDVLMDGCRILREYSDELLPMIYKMWRSIIALHRCEDIVIQRKAFLCLCLMSRVSGTFLRHRVCPEVLPIIARFLGKLQNSGNVGGKRDKTSAEVQLAVLFLKSLAELLRDLEADEGPYIIIVDAAVSCLDVRHLPEIQDASQELFARIALVHPDLVYMKLMEYTENSRELAPDVLKGIIPRRDQTPRIRVDDGRFACIMSNVSSGRTLMRPSSGS